MTALDRPRGQVRETWAGEAASFNRFWWQVLCGSMLAICHPRLTAKASWHFWRTNHWGFHFKGQPSLLLLWTFSHEVCHQISALRCLQHSYSCSQLFPSVSWVLVDRKFPPLVTVGWWMRTRKEWCLFRDLLTSECESTHVTRACYDSHAQSKHL